MLINKFFSLKNSKTFFFNIILLNILIRFIFLICIDENILNFSDQTKYISMSDAFLNKTYDSSGHAIMRVPGYPFFVFLLRYLFDNLIFVIIFQNLIGIFTLFLSYNLFKLISKKYSLHLTFLFSINLNVILYQNLILTEAIFITFFIILIYFFLKLIKKKNIKNLIFFSLFVGITSLIRPQLYYIYPFIFLLIFVVLETSIYKKFGYFLIFFLISKSFILVWEYRNYKTYDSSFFVIAKEINLTGYYLPLFDQYEKKMNFIEAKKERIKDWNHYLEKNLSNETKNLEDKISKLLIKDKLAEKYFFTQLKDYKITTIFQGIFVGTLKTLISPSFVEVSYWFKLKKVSFSSTDGVSFVDQLINYLFELKNTNTVYLFLLIMSLIITFLLKITQLIGFIVFFKNKPKSSMLFLIFIIFFLVLLGPIGAPRYRVPFEIFLTVYLLVGIKFLYYLNKKKIFKYK